MLNRFGVSLAAVSLALAGCRGAPESTGGSLGEHVYGARPNGSSALFANGSFEDGGTGGAIYNWTITTYKNTSGPTCADGGDCANFPPTTETALNLGSAGIGANTTSAIAGDGGPNTAFLGIFDGGSAVRYPFFGNWSALINDRSGSKYPTPNYASNANMLSQSFATSAADVDPIDGNIHVRFVIQPDLEDGAHTPVQQAYFFVQVKDVTTNVILKTQYFYANEPGVQFFVEDAGTLSGNPVDYTNWILFDVASQGGSISIGDVIQADVIASGCVPGGHAGEVVVDGFGSSIPGLNVVASAPGVVLVNGQITYVYTVRNGGAVVATTPVVTQPIPPGTAFSSVSTPNGVTCTAPAIGATTGNVVCTFPSLAAAASSNFSINVTAPGAPSNDVPNGLYFVSAANAPALIGPKVDTKVAASSSAANSADLAVTISDGVPAVAYGSKPTYTITVTNNGPGESPAAIISAPTPSVATASNWICAGNTPSATIVAGHPNTGNSANGTGAVSTEFDLKAGASATCTYTLTLPATSSSTTLAVTANATDNTVFDPNVNNNTATDTDEFTTSGNLETVSVTTAGTGGGTVTSSPAGINCSANAGTCSDPFAAGNSVTLTATPVAGSTFGGWTGLVTCAEGQSSPTCTFTPAANVSATATFTQITYAITTSTTPATGGGTLTCPANVNLGANASCTVGAASGYKLTSLLDNGSDVTGNVMNNGAYTITNVQANHALSAVFTANTFQIEATSGLNGTISPQGTQTVTLGATPTFTFTPATGYHVADVQVDGVSQGAGPSYTFASVSASHAINVDYAINLYTLTPTAGANGIISPATAQTAPYGSSQTFAITPAPGFQIATLTVDGAPVTPASSYTFVNISANHTIAATFSRIAYTITPSAGANGSISPSTPQTVNAGGSSTFAITPAAGYQVASVLVDGSPVGAVTSYTFSNVGASHTISATFSVVCSTDTDCGAGNFCDTNQTPHACVPTLTGGTCQRNAQCSTGDCVDGVCCDRACNGQCEACDVSGHSGTCTTVASGEPHGNRTTCAGGTGVCAGTCDGTSATSCDYPKAAVTCAPAACVNGAAAPASVCGGNGSCAPATAASCVNYACAAGGTSCNTACTKDTDCNAADYCNASGACVPKGPSKNSFACTADDQCAGGHCTDGFCCDTACDGQCQACDIAGSQGTCTLVPSGAAPHGTRTACADDGSGCGGTCGGANALACAYPAGATSCRAPSCTTGSAILAAGCNGAGACPAVQTQACTPYVCGANACSANCTTDAQCVSGDWCAGGVCVPELKPGAACAGNDQCGSGFCVDGVCCNTSCNGQCEACDATGSKGTCTPVTGNPHGPRNACATDDTACGGTCDGSRTTACTYPAADTSCRSASCNDGTAVLAASCNGAGACPGVQDVSCGTYQCGAATCRGNCAVDGDCASGSFCAAGVCTPKSTPGATCSAADQCASGNCVDGVCCNTACDGQCAACDVPGSVGTCTAAPAGAPEGKRNPCGSDGSSCGGACDGTSMAACEYPTNSCRDPSCSGGTATLGASCDGAGHCPGKSTQSCGEFICGPTSCNGNCTTDSSCASGSFCSAGVCVPKSSTGSTCAKNSDCASAECVDGVCCNVACDGQCEACDVTGHAGTCTPVMGAPKGSRASCTTDGSSCGGACDGSNVVTCSYPGASTQCRGGSCASGVSTSAESCNGSGTCPSSTQTACGDYNCSGTSCGTACSSSDECATGSSCSNGTCAPITNTGGFTVLGSGGCASGGSGSLLPLFVLAFFAMWRLSRRRGRKSAAAAVALAVAFGVPAAAQAQTDTSVIVDCFQPGAGAYDILGIGSAQTADHLAFHLSAYIDYANQPLRIVSTSNPNDRVILLRYQSMLYLGASIGLSDRFEVGMVLPTLIAQHATQTELLGNTTSAAGSGVGDIKFVPKIKLYGGNQVFVAVAVPFTLPTGAGHPYLSEGYVTASPEARLETNQDWLPVRVMGNAGISFRKGHDLGDLHLGNAFTWGGGALYPFLISGQKFAGMATINGEIGLTLNNRGERPIEADAAARWYSPSGVSLTVGAGPGISTGYGTPRFRLFAGLAYDPEHAPPPPPPAPCVCAACLLAEDVFLTTEAGKSVAVPIHAMAQSGSPIRIIGTTPPANGTLVKKDDGSLSYVPNAGFSGKDETTLTLTDDGNRIAREKAFIDVLPPPLPPPAPVAVLPIAPLPLPDATPAPAPAPGPEPERVIRNGHYALLAAVHFAIDKAIILPESFAILDKVGKILNETPDFKKVRIEGHTDSQGKAEHNRQLSMRRATAVLNYLVKKSGIVKSRLVAAGFGPDFPIDTNDTVEGRARNRRVEFVVIEGAKPGEEIKDTPRPDTGAGKP